MTETREQMEARHARERAEWEAANADPLLVEAREICGRRDIDFYAEFKEGKYDAQPVMLVALAALRRGMELRPPAPAMDEGEIEALVDDLLAQHRGTGRGLTHLARAAIRATLATIDAALAKHGGGDA